MNSVTVTIVGLPALQRRLKEMGPEVNSGVRNAMNAAFKQAVSFTTTNYLTGGTSASRLAVRSGHLRKSVKYKVSGAGQKVDGEFGSYDTPYAQQHEFGGTVRPTHGQYLAIPLRAVKTSAGVARITAGDLRSNPGALGYTSTFVHKGIIFGQRGGGRRAGQDRAGRIDPLFVLKRSVNIPARPWLRPTFDRSIIPMLNAELDAMMSKAVSK